MANWNIRPGLKYTHSNTGLKVKLWQKILKSKRKERKIKEKEGKKKNFYEGYKMKLFKI